MPPIIELGGAGRSMIFLTAARRSFAVRAACSRVCYSTTPPSLHDLPKFFDKRSIVCP
jgi:hypothetical protein